MSDGKTRSFTLRLTPEDQAALAQLCDLYGLDRPNSIRQAIRQVLVQNTSIGSSGYFIPVGQTAPSSFLVLMNRKSVRE
jgi:hypothetical protein